MSWFVPENTWIMFVVAFVLGLVIVVIMRIKNLEYPRLETRQKPPAQQRKRNNGDLSKNRPNRPEYRRGEGNVCRSQSNGQPLD